MGLLWIPVGCRQIENIDIYSLGYFTWNLSTDVSIHICCSDSQKLLPTNAGAQSAPLAHTHLSRRSKIVCLFFSVVCLWVIRMCFDISGKRNCFIHGTIIPAQRTCNIPIAELSLHWNKRRKIYYKLCRKKLDIEAGPKADFGNFIFHVRKRKRNYKELRSICWESWQGIAYLDKVITWGCRKKTFGQVWLGAAPCSERKKLQTGWRAGMQNTPPRGCWGCCISPGHDHRSPFEGAAAWSLN